MSAPRRKRPVRWVRTDATTIDHPGWDRKMLKPGERPQQVPYVERIDEKGRLWVDEGDGRGMRCLGFVPEVTDKDST